MTKKKYDICNILVQASGGKIEDYIFERVDNYANAIKNSYKPEQVKTTISLIVTKKAAKKTPEAEKIIPMQYGSHQITSVAFRTKKGREKKSVFSNGKTRIYDICLLYNFFIGKNSCLKEDLAFFTHREKLGTILKDYNYNINSLIEKVLQELNKAKWKNNSNKRENLAFLFLLDARDPKGFQIGFFEKYLCLEILEEKFRAANEKYFNGKIFNNFQFVRRFNRFNSGHFTEVLKLIRNLYAHTGNCSLPVFKRELVVRNHVNGRMINYINSLSATEFNKFKFTAMDVLDYFLSMIFVEIFNISAEVGSFNDLEFNKANSFLKKVS